MKIFIIDKLRNQLFIANKPEEFASIFWGRDINDFIIVVSTKSGDFQYDVRIARGDIAHIERFIKQYE